MFCVHVQYYISSLYITSIILRYNKLGKLIFSTIRENLELIEENFPGSKLNLY